MNLFFDLDGTLVDAKVRMWRLYADFARVHEATPIPLSVYVAKKQQGILERDIARDTLSQASGYMEWKKIHIEEPKYVKLDTLYPGVTALLKRLAKQHILFILTSRVNRQVTLTQLAAKGILPFFTEVLTTPGADAVRLKTHGLVDACARHTLAAKQSVIIGDSEVEWGVGKSLGIPCISVTYGLRGEAFFRSLGQTRCVGTIARLENELTQIIDGK